MAIDADVVVFSEAPKDLGPDVKVIVGLPSRNPWTLPFAHKSYFAKNADQYDLFIYSEDDNDVKEEHIHAFLNATDQLASDEIAGYLRYEVSSSGDKTMDEVFGSYHWKPESVRRRGEYTIAEFTNEHTGFYILTQSQLKRAIASGGFLREPYRGRYNWPETAATDPYINCGFRKVICISDLEKFLIHHMPDRYASQHCVTLKSFQQQIQTLMAICDGLHPASTLCKIEPDFPRNLWSKSCYEKPNDELLKMVPNEAKSILSVGCGWGATETRLKERGSKVTAIPLNSVFGAAVEQMGIEVIYGSWDEVVKSIGDRQFDCILISNLLHLQPDPQQMVKIFSKYVSRGGVLLLSGPNFDRLPRLFGRIFGMDEFWRLRRYDLGGVSVCGPRGLSRQILKSGLQVDRVRWLNGEVDRGFLRGKHIPLGRFSARDWILQARRQAF